MYLLHNDIIHSQISQPALSVQTFTRVQTVSMVLDLFPGSLCLSSDFCLLCSGLCYFIGLISALMLVFFINHSISGVLLLASLVHIIDDNSSSSFTFSNLFLKLCFVTLTSVHI